MKTCPKCGAQLRDEANFCSLCGARYEPSEPAQPEPARPEPIQPESMQPEPIQSQPQQPEPTQPMQSMQSESEQFPAQDNAADSADGADASVTEPEPAEFVESPEEESDDGSVYGEPEIPDFTYQPDYQQQPQQFQQYQQYQQPQQPDQYAQPQQWQQPQQPQQPQYAYPYANQNPQANYYVPPVQPMQPNLMQAQSETITTWKSVCSSSVALVAVIAYTLSIVLNLIQSVLHPDFFLDELVYIFGELRMFDAMQWVVDEMNNLTTAMIYSAVIGMIPSILIAIGMWITYATAKNKRPRMPKTGGLTLVKTIMIINIIGISLLMAAVLVVTSMIASGAVPYIEEAAAVGTALIVGELIVFLLVIVFYAKVVGTINEISKTVRTGFPYSRLSVFVAVIAIIAAVSMFASTATSISEQTMPPLMALSSFASSVASLCFGIFIFKFRGAMKGVTSFTPYGLFTYANVNANNAAGYYYQPQDQQDQQYQQYQPQQPQYGMDPNYAQNPQQMQNQTQYQPPMNGTVNVKCPVCGCEYTVAPDQRPVCPRCGSSAE